jgi:hypothetical protein
MKQEPGARPRAPGFSGRKEAMTTNMDMTEVLRQLALLRTALPQAKNKPPADRHDGRADTGLLPDAIEDFERQALIESLETLTRELQAAIDEQIAAQVSQGLEIYYATEELVRSGQHPHLAENLEEMRRAWQQRFGTTIPERKPPE